MANLFLRAHDVEVNWAEKHHRRQLDKGRATAAGADVASRFARAFCVQGCVCFLCCGTLSPTDNNSDDDSFVPAWQKSSHWSWTELESGIQACKFAKQTRAVLSVVMTEN